MTKFWSCLCIRPKKKNDSVKQENAVLLKQDPSHLKMMSKKSTFGDLLVSSGTTNVDGARARLARMLKKSKHLKSLRSVGYFETLNNLQEGDLVLFRTDKFMSKLQRAFVKSGGFDHIGIVVTYDDCSDSCCSKELKKLRKRAGIGSWHTLEADAEGVSLYRFTPSCILAYNGVVCIRSLKIDRSEFSLSQQEELKQQLRDFSKTMNGRPYEKRLLEVLRSANYMGQNTQEDLSSVFCSELVAAALKAMGLVSESTESRTSNSYIPGDFASANQGTERGIRFKIGISYDQEKVIDCHNTNAPITPPVAPKKEIREGSAKPMISRKEKGCNQVTKTESIKDFQQLVDKESTLDMHGSRCGSVSRQNVPLDLEELGGSNALTRFSSALVENEHCIPRTSSIDIEEVRFATLVPHSVHSQFVCVDTKDARMFFNFNCTSNAVNFTIYGPIPQTDTDSEFDKIKLLQIAQENCPAIVELQNVCESSGQNVLVVNGWYLMIWINETLDQIQLHYDCTFEKVDSLEFF